MKEITNTHQNANSILGRQGFTVTGLPDTNGIGNGRFTIPDRKNFFMIARGSVQECLALMEISFRRNLLTADAHVQLRSDLEEISKMLSGLINGLENRKM